MIPKNLVYVAGLVQAVAVAVAAFASQAHDLTGRPLVIALIWVAVSAATSYFTGLKVDTAVAREVKKAQVFP